MPPQDYVSQEASDIDSQIRKAQQELNQAKEDFFVGLTKSQAEALRAAKYYDLAANRLNGLLLNRDVAHKENIEGEGTVPGIDAHSVHRETLANQTNPCMEVSMSNGKGEEVDEISETGETGGDEAAGSPGVTGGSGDDDGHQPVSSPASRPPPPSTGGESDEAGGQDESEFESVEGWSENVLTEAGGEEGAEEALVEAYFAEADSQEFFPFLALLAPLAKAVLPSIVAGLGQAAGPRIQQLMARLRQRRKIRPKSEAGGDEAGAEAFDQEALAEALQQLEVIIGTDDRVQIQQTSAKPWRRICHLRIKAANGSNFLGTGFFIGPRTLITAGHCVYMSSQGGWVQSIEVSPGRNGNSRPYGKCDATSFRSVRGWVSNKSRDHDYGAIILPASCPTAKIGAFGYANYTDTYLKSKRLNTAGYPGDKPAGTMWFHGRKATGLTSRVITYDIDTAGGQSGSPVWLTANGKRKVVGIHTNGSPGGNSATRIVKPVFDNLSRWRSEGGS